MYKYEVGQPYKSSIRQYPECLQYNYRAGAHELLLFFNHPDTEEVASVASGLSHFAFCEEGDVILFLARFEPKLPWSDAPFTIHVVPETERTLPPETTGDERAVLSVMLIGADDGLIKAIRAVNLSPDFTRKLHEAIRRQAGRAFDQAAYDHQVNSLFARFLTKDLLKRAVAQCKGGA